MFLLLLHLPNNDMTTTLEKMLEEEGEEKVLGGEGGNEGEGEGGGDGEGGIASTQKQKGEGMVYEKIALRLVARGEGDELKIARYVLLRDTNVTRAGVLQSVAACCSVLVCCRVLKSVAQSVEHSCSELKGFAQHVLSQDISVTRASVLSMLQRVAACCSVLQLVAACCSVLQRVRYVLSRDTYIMHADVW